MTFQMQADLLVMPTHFCQYVGSSDEMQLFPGLTGSLDSSRVQRKRIREGSPTLPSGPKEYSTIQ